MRSISRILALAALVVAGSSCGDVARQGRSPVYLVINQISAAQGNHNTQFSAFLISDVLTFVTTPPPCTQTNPCPTVFNDVGQAVFSIALKDIGAPGTTVAPTSNNAVTITRYHVEFRRADGRNTPGIDVPYGFDGGTTGTVTGSTTLTLGFELVRHTAKETAPLVQLINSPNIISTIAYITFYGTDQVGNAISATGTIQVDFGNFGDT